MANAQFIALASPSTILSLIARMERLEAALKPFAFIADCEPQTPDGDSTIVNISRCRDARRALETPANPIEEVVDDQPGTR